MAFCDAARAEEFADLVDHGLAMHRGVARERVAFTGEDRATATGFRDLFLGLAHLNADLRFRSGDHALCSSPDAT